MTQSRLFYQFRRLVFFALVASCVALFLSAAVVAQPKYRTFSQTSLAEKKAKAGKPIAANVCFKFFNQTGATVNGLVARCNGHFLSVIDSGGASSVTISDKGKVFTATGISVLPGDSLELCFTIDRKAIGAKMSNWYWMVDGFMEGAKQLDIFPVSETLIRLEPNGGNVLEYLYKRVVTRPAGIVLGTDRSDSATIYGWIRYLKADRKYFPHIGEARCFDFIVNGSGGQKPFVKQLKNPHVKKHDNHLLGEVHSLKLAVIANDSGVTEPIDTLATALGDLLYNDAGNPSDPLNGLTIRGIIALADSALTYCTHFDSGDYAAYDAGVSRINTAFDGDYVAESFDPFLLAGTHTLAEVGFLQPNPAVMPSARPTQRYSVIDETPQVYALAQNYPNPFNPSTTIEFTLPQATIVTLKVYNMLGQEVATLLDRADMEEGDQSVNFDASRLSSGVYLYRIMTQSVDGGQVFQQVKRMVLVK